MRTTRHVSGRARSRCVERPPAMADNQNTRVEVLKLVLADVEHERDRLRDARASFTARLGPLPASAAVVTGIIAAAAGEVAWWYAAAAGLVFVGMLAMSVAFGGLKPYREIRREHQRSYDPTWKSRGESIGFRVDDRELDRWLVEKIRLEEKIYGRLGERERRWWPAREPESLSDALDTERAAANIVQALLVVIFAVLVVGIAV
jgi:hypothetical protein